MTTTTDTWTAFAVTISNTPRSPRRCWQVWTRFAPDQATAERMAAEVCEREGLTLRGVEPTALPAAR